MNCATRLRLGLGMAALAAAFLPGAWADQTSTRGIAFQPAPAPEKPHFLLEDLHQPTEKYPNSHASSITQAKNGDLLVCWYAGTAEKHPDVAVVGVRRKKGEKTWSELEVWQDTPDKSEGNPMLWTDPKGRVWLFYEVMHAMGWSGCTLHYRVSEDHGKTWGPSQDLHTKWGVNYRNHTLVLSTGRWLIPAYDELIGYWGRFFYSDDQGKTWTKTDALRVDRRALGIKITDTGRGDCLQPSVIERKDGSLYCLMRCGKNDDFLWESISLDHGATWSSPALSKLPNPGGGAEMMTLKNGHVVLIYNDSPDQRDPLTAAISYDEARTWAYKRDLIRSPQGQDWRVHYPSVIQGADGLIHVSFTNGKHISHLEFNEAWVLEGTKLDGAAELPPAPAGDEEF